LLRERFDHFRRPASAVLIALLGLVLLGLDLAPRLDSQGEVRMVWSLFGSEGGRGIAKCLPEPQPLAAFADAIRSPWSPCWGAALILSIVIGLATSSLLACRLSRPATPGFRAACITGWALALDPAIVAFVATRESDSLTRYIDAGDLFRALGLVALWIALMTWRGPRTASSMRTRTGELAVSHDPAASPRGHRAGWPLFTAMLVAALVPSAVSWLALDRRPLTNDEHAYLAQARLLADGELFRNLGSLADFFPSANTVIDGGRWFLFTLPGHSAALVPGTWLGWPELVPRILAMLSVALTWSIAKQLSFASPNWAAWCLAISPAFLGVESLYLSHTTSLPCALLLCWCALKVVDTPFSAHRWKTLGFAALGGFAFSAALVTRPVTAIALAVPVLGLLWRERRRELVPSIGVAICATLPLVVWLASVNRTLTGSAFHTAYGAYDRDSNAVYGAVDAPTAISISAYNLARMSVWLSGVAPGILLPILGVVLGGSARRMWFIAALPISLFAFYVLHPFQGIPWVGAVYLSDGLPALALLSAQGLFVVEEAFGPFLRRALCAISVAGSALLLFTHFRLAEQTVALRERPYVAARSHGITRGVVFVHADPWSMRRLYPLRPPEPGDRLVFACDLGRRNAELLSALGTPPAWIFDPQSGELRSR
jgi:hypothetical protein